MAAKTPAARISQLRGEKLPGVGIACALPSASSDERRPLSVNRMPAAPNPASERAPTVSGPAVAADNPARTTAAPAPATGVHAARFSLLPLALTAAKEYSTIEMPLLERKPAHQDDGSPEQERLSLGASMWAWSGLHVQAAVRKVRRLQLPGDVPQPGRFALIALVVIVAFGGWLRFSDANWDGGTRVHPDERFITSVDNVIHWPSTPWGYFEPRSPLSPYNTNEGKAYSYGTLPLFGTKLVADAVGRSDYDHLYLVGRWLSALAETATVALVFLIGLTLLAEVGERRAMWGALLAAALYAVTTASVQAAHFFTTDPWLDFFGTLTFYLAVLTVREGVRAGAKAYSALVVSAGICLGLTAACKISGLFIALPVAIALVGRMLAARSSGTTRPIWRLYEEALVVLVTAYVGFRVASPYSFAHANWIDIRLSSDYRAALAQQRDILDGKAIFPPTYQWLLSRRVSAPFRNLVVWQLGIPFGIAALTGLGLLVASLVRSTARFRQFRALRRNEDRVGALVAFTTRLMLVSFVLLVFLYMSTRFQHMGRYLLPIVPLLAVAAGYGVVVALGGRVRVLAAATAFLVVSTGAYAVAFHNIYTGPTPLVAATNWITANVPPGSSIGSENWDNSLPIGSAAQPYKLLTVPVFDPDDGTKLRKLYNVLSTSDYYALSSPRAWNTIGRLPGRYPLMVRFYRDLFAGRLGFKRVATFRSEPHLLGVHIDDLSAEEAFWVYDHPPVMIFRRTGPIGWSEFRRSLCDPVISSVCT
jgi:dolichyl-phosphate-mannose-protein mannosyltransferase